MKSINETIDKYLIESYDEDVVDELVQSIISDGAIYKNKVTPII
jgi:hypothetical protein